MNAYELAEHLEKANYVGASLSATMLRQQADKIKNMEQWEKRYIDRILELEKLLRESEH